MLLKKGSLMQWFNIDAARPPAPVQGLWEVATYRPYGTEPNRVGYSDNRSDVQAMLSLMKLAGGNDIVHVIPPRNAALMTFERFWR
jgi:hypothetical protein